MFVWTLSTHFTRSISHSKKNWARRGKKCILVLCKVKWSEVKWSEVKWPLVLLYFNKTWISSTDFRKIQKCKITWKSIQWEPNCSMRTDGRTDGRSDMTKLIVGFRNSANAHKDTAGHMWRKQKQKQKQYLIINLVTLWYCTQNNT